MLPSSPSPDRQDAESVTPFSFLLEREERARTPLLSAAKSGVILRSSIAPRSVWEWIFAAAGLIAVLVGAWSALSFGVAALGRTIPAGSLAAGPAFSQGSFSAPLSGTNAASTTVENGITPVRIDIDSIGVHATVESVGKNAQGNMGSPSDYKTVAWYSPGTRPGAPGSAAFAGHLNNSLSTSGAFANLDKLRVGDTVVITDAAGHKRGF